MHDKYLGYHNGVFQLEPLGGFNVQPSAKKKADDLTPLGALQEVMPEQFIPHLISEARKTANLATSKLKITTNVVWKFILVLILMGLVKLPIIKGYWAGRNSRNRYMAAEN